MYADIIIPAPCKGSEERPDNNDIKTLATSTHPTLSGLIGEEVSTLFMWLLWWLPDWLLWRWFMGLLFRTSPGYTWSDTFRSPSSSLSSKSENNNHILFNISNRYYQLAQIEGRILSFICYCCVSLLSFDSLVLLILSVFQAYATKK